VESPFFSLAWIFGLNDTDPPTSLPDNQCTVAVNVEFNKSAIGERRLGCTVINLPSSITADVNIQVISYLYRHLPTTDEADSELWVLGQHLTASNFVLTRKTTGWATATFSPTDNIEVINNQGFEVQARTLHGKLFIAYPSVGGIDRLHVVDQGGTTVRRTGLAEPAAPAVAETGAGTFSGKRYYRVRYTVQDGAGKTLRRSEPSESTPYNPADFGSNGASARITRPALIGEGETHWEAEASLDDAEFFVIATTLVATTTVDDSVAFTVGYNGTYELSEDIGDYALIRSGKFLATDEDRLLVGGSWEDDELASTVSWTPVFNAEGAGNDERHETDTDPHLSLDGFEGGPLTHLSNPVDGFIWAFKRSHTYRLSRTRLRARAYEAIKISDSLGALPGSVVQGVDEMGSPCLYFLDPETGPCRTGGSRLVTAASRDILNTWRTINTDAIIVSRGVFYPESRQVHWWIATDDATVPNLKLVLQTNKTRETEDGIRNGWSLADGRISRAYSVCLYADNIDESTTRSLVLRPFIGTLAADGYVLRCDTGNDDNGEAYSARIVTKPYTIESILNKFGVLGAALLAKAHATASIKLTLVLDFGVEEPRTVTIALAAVGSETQVIKQLRNLTGAQFYALQLEFEDIPEPAGSWELNRFDLKLTPNETG
jgi:hypothetical protein